MTNRIRVALAGARYDRTQPLIEGTVRPIGVELNYLPMTIEEVFWRALRYHEFDATELSLGYYIRQRSAGDKSFVGIPVFPSRFFRQGCVFVRDGSSLESLGDLKGKTIGLPEYTMTACVWLRGLLQEEFGVAPHEISWRHGGIESPRRRERAELPVPAGIELQTIGPNETLNSLLANGQLDAVFSPRILSDYWTGRIRRLLPNFAKVEAEYFDRTHIFPMMHLIAIRADVYDRHPWVAKSLFDAYQDAKRITYEWLADVNALPVSLPWYVSEWEHTRRIFGLDPWQDGLEPNRKALSTLCRYLLEQKLIDKEVDLEALFAPNTLEGFVI